MRRSQGFSLIEVLSATALVGVAAMVAVAYVSRASDHATWAKDKLFARQKALSILAELRAYVEGGEGEVAADLDGFDDGVSYSPTLTITPDPLDPGAFVEPTHPISDNRREDGEWRWYRQITVRHYGSGESRDMRLCTVRLYRMRSRDVMPGEKMADVSSVIRTVGESEPTTQVFDLYLVAAENVPGWWVHMDALQPFVEAALQDLETRNPGLVFRRHWITRLGYGRDEEYAPYTNQTRDSRANTPWAYVYPGAMPSGESTERYYVPERMSGRMNLDGELTPTFMNDQAPSEPYSDDNHNGRRDPGESFTDENGNGMWDLGNPVPYALADQHNHCMRLPDALRRFRARVAAGQESEDTPTLRILLDEMQVNPDKYRNAIVVNLHGEMLPMPPTRNYSDAAAAPELRQGWRVVTHPERLRPKRVAGNGTASDAPRFRVHAFKTSFPAGNEALMTQEEPYLDTNKNGAYDPGETYQDWNANGAWDAGIPATLVFHGGIFGEDERIGSSDFSGNANGATNPTLIVERLPGGIDADGNGTPDPYTPFSNAPQFPESFADWNGDGRRQVAEPYLDLNGNGAHDVGEPHQELDGGGGYTGATETLADTNGNGRYDAARPAEPFTDGDGDGVWDAAEPYWDRNGNGLRDGPANPSPPAWQPWNPSDLGNTAAEDSYVYNFGEPFRDLNANATYDEAEAFFDSNGNGVRDGGFERGEMWFTTTYDGANKQTIVSLYGTPLEAPLVGSQGLSASRRLYDLDYVPCPTPDSSAPGSAPFVRDLAWSGSVPKNTARWRVTLPLARVRGAFEAMPGANDGDVRDVLIACETRIGTDLSTGTMWPARSRPQDLSTTYAWFNATAESIPYSERFQMRGDPRHCPYADLSQTGDTAPNGYNWFFDNLRDGDGDATSLWLAFEPTRLRDGWRSRNDNDVPHMLQWLRESLVSTQSLFTTLSGFSFYYLSCGGDVGFDSANGYPNSVPMDGLPHGVTGDVYENTITSSPGSFAQRGSRKFVRSNAGADAGRRAGGSWWSKPWIGELFDDADYASEWKPWGNLRASLSGSSSGYRLIKRVDAPGSQMPYGTTLLNRLAFMSTEGSTSFFNIGGSTSTFHHQFASGQTGSLVGEGFELAANYGYPMPTTVNISRPFHLASSAAGSVGSEWTYTDAFPRYSADLVQRYYDHQSGSNGSGLVRLTESGPSPRSCYVVVNGIDRVANNGASFIARWAVLSLIHSFLTAGQPGAADRIEQVPRVAILSPNLTTEIDQPTTLAVKWSASWTRWDAQKYTDAYPDDFAGDEGDIVYRLLYSRDNGATWMNMRTNDEADVGVLDWIDGSGPDPARTVGDWNPGGDETYTWPVPAELFPQGSYKIRIECYLRRKGLHYAFHQEKFYVKR